MTKSNKRRSSVMRSIQNTAKSTLPVVNKGLKTVGSTAKDVAEKSIPVIEKGVSAVYGTMATGLDLGVKGVETISKKMSNKGTRKHKHKHSRRSHSLSAGKRHRKSRKH